MKLIAIISRSGCTKEGCDCGGAAAAVVHFRLIEAPEALGASEDGGPTVSLARANSGGCPTPVTALQAHDSHSPPWYTKISEGGEEREMVRMPNYIERVAGAVLAATGTKKIKAVSLMKKGEESAPAKGLVEAVQTAIGDADANADFAVFMELA